MGPGVAEEQWGALCGGVRDNGKEKDEVSVDLEALVWMCRGLLEASEPFSRELGSLSAGN
jgi:hypothetical protein